MGDSTLNPVATYNLSGGLLQLAQNEVDGGNVTFNFTGGTLQAFPGTYHATELGNAFPITVGTAASNVATFDANGMTIDSNSTGLPATGPGQLRVIDSKGGGTVILGTYSTVNTYSGGTTILSGKLQMASAGGLPTTGILTIGGAGQSSPATFDLNSQQVSIQGLVTASNLAVINFASPGTDLITVTGGVVQLRSTRARNSLSARSRQPRRGCTMT